jgi:nodulation protein E
MSKVSNVHRVAITGLGAISSAGVGVPALWNGLLGGRGTFRRIERFDPANLTIQIAAEVAEFTPPSLPGSQIELLDRFSQFALVAADEALQHAGLTIDEANRDRIGVSMGSGFGGCVTQDDRYQSIYGKGAARVHPFSIPRMMHSAAASHLSMTRGLRGPTLCFTTACAAAAHAIGEAGEIIRSGRADVMLAGGSEAPITFGVMKCWEAMRVLAPANGDATRACRPFSRDRSGLVLAEGAGILVLESWEHARARGALILAELAGYGATADAGHITQPGLDAPARAITLALEQAGLRPERVSYVNAHGTGTKLNDSAETEIIKRAFGAHAPKLAVSSTKSVHGHAIGASAALELIACVLAVRNCRVPPTANFTETDPECDLDYVPNQSRDLPVEVAVSNSFAFGGLNAALVVKRVDN